MHEGFRFQKSARTVNFISLNIIYEKKCDHRQIFLLRKTFLRIQHVDDKL